MRNAATAATNAATIATRLTILLTMLLIGASLPAPAGAVESWAAIEKYLRSGGMVCDSRDAARCSAIQPTDAYEQKVMQRAASNRWG